MESYQIAIVLKKAASKSAIIINFFHILIKLPKSLHHLAPVNGQEIPFEINFSAAQNPPEIIVVSGDTFIERLKKPFRR